MIGKTIGHYTIEERIGQGGMGVVYRATDGRLRKSVVLKFLPDETARDETARRRLLREARAAAQLDHPYICHVYEVGEADGTDYIAMEYVSGQTLQEKLKEGLLSVADCLRIATEIAEALDKAQQKGIVQHMLRKMLAKEPARRYQLVREICTDLAVLLQDSQPALVPSPVSTSSWSLPVWLEPDFRSAVRRMVGQPGTGNGENQKLYFLARLPMDRLFDRTI